MYILYYLEYLPFSCVNCFSGKRNMAACKTVASDRPLALNAKIDVIYCPPGFNPATVNRGIGDVKLAFKSFLNKNKLIQRYIQRKF